MRLAYPFEVKNLDEQGRFTGLASTYGNLDDQSDRIQPGAFTASLLKRGDERPILWSHDMAQPIGIGMLSDLAEGLHVDASLDLDVTAGKEAYSRLKKGIARGLSIGFRIPTNGYEIVKGERLLKEVDVLEVSLVAVPANQQAQVLSVKSLGSIRTFEAWLHEAGFSKSEARALASHGWKGLDPVGNEQELLLEELRRMNAA